MTLPSEAIGFHQSDLIIRSAIMAMLEDVRRNPWLLDYVFGSLPKDTLTKEEYGQKEIDNAKRWFVSTKIPVFMSTRVDDATLPAISISLIDSSEAELTLGDVHYESRQDDDRLWPALCDNFRPASYNPLTGFLTVPTTIGDSLVIVPGMILVDTAGASHEILTVVDDYSLTIAPVTGQNFGSCVIKGTKPSGVVAFESVKMKETYSIGCHVQGEQTHLTYLHTILAFCLYRYKAAYLEARGFERTVISSTDFRRNEQFENELTWSRHIQITGFVQQVWPAAFSQKVTSVTPAPKFSIGSQAPNDWSL